MTAEILNLRRRVLGLSQAELARRARLSYQRVWRVITSGAEFSAEESARLSLALSVAEQEQEADRARIAGLTMALSA